MDCRTFPLYDWTLGLLDDAALASARSHWESCAGCRAKAEALARLVRRGAELSREFPRAACPTPETLLGWMTDTPEAWVEEHVASCTHCREEVEAVRDAEAAVAPEGKPLAGPIAQLIAGNSQTRTLAQRILSLVRETLGESGPAERWRRAVAALIAETGRPGAEGAYAAPGEGAAPSEGSPLEFSLEVEGVRVRLRAEGEWLRVEASRDGSPLSGMDISLENVLGEIAATETDRHGHATLREDLPGVKKLRIKVKN